MFESPQSVSCRRRRGGTNKEIDFPNKERCSVLAAAASAHKIRPLVGPSLYDVHILLCILDDIPLNLVGNSTTSQ